MTLDLSDAIELARDLLQTSGDFHSHDPELAAEFSDRAYEICDDLGIDPDLLGDPPVEPADDDTGNALVETAAIDDDDDDARQTGEQLRDLLQQQARVLNTIREAESEPAPKTRKRIFRLFGGGSAAPDFGTLQSA